MSPIEVGEARAPAHMLARDSDQHAIATGALFMAVLCSAITWLAVFGFLPMERLERLGGARWTIHVIPFIYVIGLTAVPVCALRGPPRHRWAIGLVAITYAPFFPRFVSWFMRQIQG